MEAKKYGVKRNLDEWEKMERPTKKTYKGCVEIDDKDDDNGVKRIHKFRVLLPNGMCLGLKIREPKAMEMPLKEFLDYVKEEYKSSLRELENQKKNPKRRIDWTSRNLHFLDVFDHVLDRTICFRRLKPNKYHILRLYDGSGEAETYENMWDLTPDTELLMELPAEYSFETALADLIDNSLQAVWSNGVNERRLLSVELHEERIEIFDTGPGMDGSDENSIVKWGKMGASLHRSSRGNGIGGKPPYLMPYFGMFGYGGSIASMHLGRHALVSSKTKESKKVYTLHLQREALLSNSGSDKTWRTDGGIRDPTEDEIRRSPQCSFTKVEIFEPRMKGLDMVQFQYKLKDIYFPYIQCDEVSNTSKTITPIEFQFNGTNLAEIEGGEVAITNLESCNGPNFILQLHFSQDATATNGQGVRVSQKANARLKLVYFPMIKGKERIDTILEKLEAEGYGTTESFESFSRISIRRLGRLLPDALWTRLPFMEPKLRVGDKAHILKRCCLRVKCFIDTDAGFNPTPSKTDLAHHHPYTTALKNFGDKLLVKEKDVEVKICKDGKQLTLLQLEKQYQEWVFQMHDLYDKEVECGGDQPVLVVSPSNKKRLGVSSDILRVHKVIPRKGASWKSGQKIKLLKGAGAGCHKNSVYATLEYILLEGLEGDAGGDARLICRPLALPTEKGCALTWHDGNASIDIGDSLSLPISVIDHDKCLAVKAADWENQVEKQGQKEQFTVEILTARHCQELEIHGALPSGSTVNAGYVPPKEIVAVVRPGSFRSGSAIKNLDQKYIVKDNSEMSIEIKFNADCAQDDIIYSENTTSSSRKGFHGLYIFPLRCKRLFEKAGIYTFSLSLRGSGSAGCESRVKVKALPEVHSWGLLANGRNPTYSARVGTCFPWISISCYDAYDNRMPFPSVPEVLVEIVSGKMLLAVVHKMKLDLSSDELTLTIKDALVESKELDYIRPRYQCDLVVSSRDRVLSVSIPCQVLPGSLHLLKIQGRNLDKHLHPGHAMEELILEMFDAYGNYVPEGLEVLLNLDGFCFLDRIGSIRKADERGCVDLSGALKVIGRYGSKISLSVSLGKDIVFKKDFQTEERELITASMVPKFCTAGSLLENIVFKIVDSEGNVDETIHDDESSGQPHTLAIKSDTSDTDDSVRYSFRHGCCTVRAIPLPQKEAIVCFVASHSRHSELHLTFEVHVLQAPKLEPGINPPHCTDGQLPLLQDLLSCRTPKLEEGDACSLLSDGKLLLLEDSSAPKDVENLVISIINEQKELEEDVLKCGFVFGNHERALEMLIGQHEGLKKDISMLQGSLGLDLSDRSGNFPVKEATTELIDKKEGTAASVICTIRRRNALQQPQNHFFDNILGVVALMGTVKSYELSRVLAEYLGEDQMLAVVCKSYSEAENLEKYEENGNVDYSRALHAVASEIGVSVSRRYHVICLEDTWPYTGGIGSDPERKLTFPFPMLSNGITPQGYLGYAVNMINLDIHHLHTRTSAGHGLRETLFYRLFGKLQVYETRAHMNMARACIKHGAVSLDGGIMRGNGVLFLGDWQSEICFPVTPLGITTRLSPHNIDIMKQIEQKSSELRGTLAEMEKKTKFLKKIFKKYNKKKDRYEKFLDVKGPLLKSIKCRSYLNI